MITAITSIDRARNWLAASRDGRISPENAALLSSEYGLDTAMLELIALAVEWARPQVSGFRVGAVGEGESGALYLGANIEFVGAPLAATVHAEQAVVANAAAHGETGLVRLAVSAAPCGLCRQFLYELESASKLQILLKDRTSSRIADYLPDAFGPADLDVAGGMLAPVNNELGKQSGVDADPLALAAAEAADRSYAPYSKSYGGAAIQVRDGRIFGGSYQENAAFNPSLGPLQAAYVATLFGGQGEGDIERVAIATAGTSVDHHKAAADLLAILAPGASLTGISLRAPNGEATS